jgi:hypothetical protein
MPFSIGDKLGSCEILALIGAAIAAQNHPNICQIYDVGPDFLVMESVGGKSLSGPLSGDAAL